MIPPYEIDAMVERAKKVAADAEASVVIARAAVAAAVPSYSRSVAEVKLARRRHTNRAPHVQAALQEQLAAKSALQRARQASSRAQVTHREALCLARSAERSANSYRRHMAAAAAAAKNVIRNCAQAGERAERARSLAVRAQSAATLGAEAAAGVNAVRRFADFLDPALTPTQITRRAYEQKRKAGAVKKRG